MKRGISNEATSARCVTALTTHRKIHFNIIRTVTRRIEHVASLVEELVRLFDPRAIVELCTLMHSLHMLRGYTSTYAGELPLTHCAVEVILQHSPSIHTKTKAYE